MMVEIILPAGMKGQWKLFETYQRTFINEFDARPHWGLDMDHVKNEDTLRRLYPRWDDWKAVYERFNSKGTFNNPLTDRLGISMSSCKEFVVVQPPPSPARRRAASPKKTAAMG